MNIQVERYGLLERQCRKILQELVGPVRFRRAGEGPDPGYDLAAWWTDRPRTEILIELKNAPVLTPAHLNHIVLNTARLKEKTGKAVLVFAPWIRDDQADMLRENEIFYADVLGNAWLTWPKTRTLIDIRGRRPPKTTGPKPGRLLEPAGLKVIHTLLTRPAALHQPLRTIAVDAGVGLGTVAAIMKELRFANYLVPTGPDVFRLERRRDLMDLFVRGYALKLRPACRPERVRYEVPDPLRLAKRLAGDRALQALGCALTGGVAANFLIKYLQPEAVTLHLKGGATALFAEEHRLIRDDEHGNLILLDWFAPAVLDPVQRNELPMATPLLIYAELLADGRPREVETAGMIYEKHLAAEPTT